MRRQDRGRETLAVAAAAVAAGAMIAQQVAGKAARNALFLSSFDVTVLPRMTIAGSLLSLLAVLASSRLLVRHGPARVVPAAFALSALLFTGEWLLLEEQPRAVALIVFLHMAVLGAILISGFWSVVNERFDPRVGRRMIGRIGAGGTLGGILGGVGAERLAASADVGAVLALMAVLNLLCAVGLGRVGAGARAHATEPAEASPITAGISHLGRTRYLQELGLLVGLAALTGSVINYVLQSEADAALRSGPELLRFFAVFYTAVSLLSFLVQGALGRPSLARLGLAGTVALLPMATAAAGVLGTVSPVLWAVVLLAGAEAVVSNSLFRSGYELLYNPLPAARKRSTKGLIDVGFDQLGRAAGSLGVIGVLALAGPGGGEATRLLLGLVVAVSLVEFGVSRRLHHGYVRSLAESLRDRVIDSSTIAVLDPATERTLAESTATLDRGELLRRIAEQRSPGAAGEDLGGRQPRVADRLAEAVADLRSGRPERVRDALGRHLPLEPTLVGPVLALLASRELLADALRALKAVAPRVTGQLVDALLDPELDERVRCRIPDLLRESGSRRAADGLLLGLGDRRFEVRLHCARALVQMRERDPDIAVPAAAVFAAVQREVAHGAKVWEGQRLLDLVEEEREPSPIQALLKDRTDRSLEHVFTLLALALDREPLRIAVQALNSDEAALRGTALEYLENVIPSEVWKRLRPHLGDDERSARAARPSDQILEELMRSSDSIMVNLAALRRKTDRGGVDR